MNASPLFRGDATSVAASIVLDHEEGSEAFHTCILSPAARNHSIRLQQSLHPLIAISSAAPDEVDLLSSFPGNTVSVVDGWRDEWKANLEGCASRVLTVAYGVDAQQSGMSDASVQGERSEEAALLHTALLTLSAPDMLSCVDYDDFVDCCGKSGELQVWDWCRKRRKLVGDIDPASLRDRNLFVTHVFSDLRHDEWRPFLRSVQEVAPEVRLLAVNAYAGIWREAASLNDFATVVAVVAPQR
jgi:hypothetical protein